MTDPSAVTDGSRRRRFLRGQKARRTGDQYVGRAFTVSACHLVIILALALALRLLVWRWHELYPLGGDEREYLEQALTLLRERRYEELRLMRPPLYTGFLAACIYVLDSLVQRLRLAQAVLGALTVLPLYGLALRVTASRRAAGAAALLLALSYTLAAAATELLSETLFLFGLCAHLWLLLEAGARRSRAWSAGAGLALGALILVRSVALPLLPLGFLWLALTNQRPQTTGHSAGAPRRFWVLGSGFWALSLAFALATILAVAPWTARNAVTYGALIVVDTTGAENLWLDNDPAGREAVKAQLYDMGDDMAARQRLASQRGLEVILADPPRFAAKAWAEARRFFALQFFDDMRERRAIWVPPEQVWLRVILGDGVWLLTLLAGAAGMALAPRPKDHGPRTTEYGPTNGRGSPAASSKLKAQSSNLDIRWVLAPWALYVLLTGLIFHVELRYRLPLYPALLPYAGWLLAGLWRRAAPPRWRSGLAGGLAAACVIMTLLHRPYLGESLMLAQQHAALWQADAALAAGDTGRAASAASQALELDRDSALARVALARAAIQQQDLGAARLALDAAADAVPDHPRAHMLRGAVRLAQVDSAGAGADLAYETATLEDAQGWAWDTFAPLLPAQAELDVGGGLDLGRVRGFHAAERGFRWTQSEAQVRLTGSAGQIEVRLNSGRPAGAPAPVVTVLIDGVEAGQLTAEPGWHTHRFAVPPQVAGGELTVTLRSPTFRPRDYDPINADSRALGVMVDEIRLVGP